MDALLKAIVLWLSINTGLPAPARLPEVRFADPTQIAFIHYGAFDAASQARVIAARDALPPGERRTVVSVYDDRRKMILLPVGWTPGDAPGLSALVHEMVHYMQAEAGLRYACPEEREALAYQAQAKWLEQFHTSLEAAFKIDGFTLLVSSNCPF